MCQNNAGAGGDLERQLTSTPLHLQLPGPTHKDVDLDNSSDHYLTPMSSGLVNNVLSESVAIAFPPVKHVPVYSDVNRFRKNVSFADVLVHRPQSDPDSIQVVSESEVVESGLAHMSVIESYAATSLESGLPVVRSQVVKSPVSESVGPVSESVMSESRSVSVRSESTVIQVEPEPEVESEVTESAVTESNVQPNVSSVSLNRSIFQLADELSQISVQLQDLSTMSRRGSPGTTISHPGPAANILPGPGGAATPSGSTLSSSWSEDERQQTVRRSEVCIF